MKEEKNKIGFKDLFTNPTYRARIILAAYVIFFVFLTMAIRSAPKLNITKSPNQKEPDTLEGDNTSPKEESPYEDERFKLIRSDNFSFEYIINIDTLCTTSIGKKYKAKELFIVSNSENEETLEIYADGTGVLGKSKDSEEYISMTKPYLYINYFDTKLIEQIAINSTKVSNDFKEEIFEITNIKLCEIINCPSDITDGINTIKLEYKNNYVTAIEMNYTSFTKVFKTNDNIKEVNEISFKLTYDDFSLIDEFHHVK